MANPSGLGSTLAFHASRIVIDIGVLLILASMSLPFVIDPRRSAMALDALPTLLLVVPVFIITLIPDHTRPLSRPLAWASLVLGLMALPYALITYLDAALLADTLDGGIGLGARMLVFGAVITVAGIAVGLTRSWMGLGSGGTAARRTAVPAPTGTAVPAPPATAAPARTGTLPGGPPRPNQPPGADRPLPGRAAPEPSPFGEPLFDSLEVPATKADEGPVLRQPGLVYDAAGAAERVADEDDRES